MVRCPAVLLGLEAQIEDNGGYEAMFFRVSRGRLSRSDWMLIEDAVIAAGFWMLDEHDGRHGLDGADWSIVGRRGRDYHCITRRRPRGALWDLGRLFFDLAGLEQVGL